MEVQSESKLTFWEATGIIIGHGVGLGILAVPFYASVNRWWEVILVVILAYFINLLLHLMIAELSYNNGGGQLITCFENEIFVGKLKKVWTYLTFGVLLFSVVVNISGFVAGAGSTISAWWGIDARWGMLIFYVVAALVVFFGMKIVGICSKYAVYAIVLIVAVLAVATLIGDLQPLNNTFLSFNNLIAVYAFVSFSLSAAMSVPQVVKGLQGDVKRIKASVATGLAVEATLILVITFITLLGTKGEVTEVAINGLAISLGGWVEIVGHIFTLLALITSFWANSLNLRDIVMEQLRLNKYWAWLIASLPGFILALALGSFSLFAGISSGIQMLTGLALIIAYARSRKKAQESPLLGKLGSLPFQLLVVAFSICCAVGSFIKVVKG